MTTEQEKAFEAWWSDPAAPVTTGNTREIFVAGWDSALAHRPAAVEMNSVEIENKFNNWRGNPRNVEYLCQFEAARDAWFAAWAAAKLGQLDRAKTEVLSEIKARLFTQATAAFLDGDDAEAMLLRRLANEIST